MFWLNACLNKKGPCLEENEKCMQPCMNERPHCAHPCLSPCHESLPCPDTVCTVTMTIKVCLSLSCEYIKL